MTDSTLPFDAVVVGAGTAGLTAALYLGRARRRVLVLDGGPPRNAPAHAAYGVFTRDGTPPADLLLLARADLAAYPTVEVRGGEARDVTGTEGAFRVELTDGSAVEAHRVVLATGVVDELPDVPGVRELWGGTVFHCPYCHGWEVRDQPLGVWVDGPHALHMAVLLRGWSDDVVLFTDAALDADARATLAALGVPVYESPVVALESEDGVLTAVRLADGTAVPRAGLLLGAPQHERSGIPARLGCETTEFGHVRVDMMGATSVPGVFAGGDLTNAMQSVVNAAAAGATAGAGANSSLALQDAHHAAERRTAA